MLLTLFLTCYADAAPVATAGPHPTGAGPGLSGCQLACSSATAAAMWDRWVSAWG
jgi:hypothetical protein